MMGANRDFVLQAWWAVALPGLAIFLAVLGIGLVGDPQLRHLDHAWASTVHAFQGRTVDNVIAAMEARHPHLTTQKTPRDPTRARSGTRWHACITDAWGVRPTRRRASLSRFLTAQTVGR